MKRGMPRNVGQLRRLRNEVSAWSVRWLSTVGMLKPILPHLLSMFSEIWYL